MYTKSRAYTTYIFHCFHSIEDDETLRHCTIFLSYLPGDKELEDHFKKRLSKTHTTPLLVKTILNYLEAKNKERDERASLTIFYITYTI
jgi:hypothetical protein